MYADGSRREEQRDAGDVLRRPEAAERNRPGPEPLGNSSVFSISSRDLAEPRSVDRTRRDDVGPHRGSVLDGDLTGEGDEAGLGRAVAT